ncbi:MAG: stage III sporulation protein AF [Corallococcus sp.]|nr:stage III sporulation protein AF [Corallococcus sp.]MCM1359711.1 stage III sporulation protein AF [Corallococcus sp.]MCM1395420.1 stage III sporulation protein AF [Corallococcus sp.]
MAQWVLSVAGIAILSVLADIVLPNGSSRKYVKTVIGIVVTLVVAQPVFSLFSGNGFLADYREKKSQLTPQQSYLDYVENCKDADAEAIRAAFVSADFASPSVTFSVQTRQFTVKFAEARSPELEEKAKSALALAEPKYPAVFHWNNSE